VKSLYHYWVCAFPMTISGTKTHFTSAVPETILLTMGRGYEYILLLLLLLLLTNPDISLSQYYDKDYIVIERSRQIEYTSSIKPTHSLYGDRFNLQGGGTSDLKLQVPTTYMEASIYKPVTHEEYIPNNVQASFKPAISKVYYYICQSLSSLPICMRKRKRPGRGNDILMRSSG
jgi:hypothetical protein